MVHVHNHTFYRQGRYVPILLASKSQQDQHLLRGLQMHRLDYTARDQPLNKEKKSKTSTNLVAKSSTVHLRRETVSRIHILKLMEQMVTEVEELKAKF